MSPTQQTFCGVPAAAPTLARAGPTAGTPQNVGRVAENDTSQLRVNTDKAFHRKHIMGLNMICNGGLNSQ